MKKLVPALICLFLVIPSQARTITVDDDGPGYNNIKAAINDANDGDIIFVRAGTYTGWDNKNNDFKGKAIKVCSENGPNNCIIDCETLGRGFYFHSGEGANSILEGFTIINGGGGGIRCENSSPTLSNCTFSGNSADIEGGGMYCSNSNPAIINCTFIGNYAESWGGGVSCYSSAPMFINCIFEGNSSASGGGGGVVCSGGIGPSPIFLNCTIIGNTTYGWAGDGGGIKCWGSNPRIINCTIAGNSAHRDGGGIACGYLSRPTITQCTISNNSAKRYGGAVSCDWSYAVIKSSILYGNTAERGNQLSAIPHGSFPSILTVSYSDIQGGQSDAYVSSYCVLNWGKGNIDAPPCFVDTNNGDYGLLSSSPCIDTAAPYYYLVGQYFADINGDCRLQGSGVDMGSHEFGGSADSDADLLSDADEIIYGTDTTNSETDGDGLLDGVEVLRGTNPIVANSPPGISIPADYSSIQEGLFLAFPLETVTVSPGLYNETLYFHGKNAILQSINPLDSEIVDTTIIDANGINSVICFNGTENSSCVLSGFTITNGIFSGINGNSCMAVIENNKIIGNSIPSLPANSGGGGVFNCDGVILNNTISDNSAGYAGGGIGLCDGIIRNNIISDNSSGYKGGGIYCAYGSPKITNCTITGNQGGAIYCDYGANTTIQNCTITGNRGGAIYCYGGSTTIQNCILWNNPPMEIRKYGGTLSVTYSDIRSHPSGLGNIADDPCFVEPGYWDVHGVWIDGDYHLLPWSACIDAGDNNSVPADTTDLDGDGNTTEPIPFDLDGNPRVVDGNDDGNPVVDMGAYELLPPMEVQMKFTPQALNPGSKGKWVKAHFVLPEGFIVEDVDTDSPAKIVEPFYLESDHMNVFINEEDLVGIEAAFDRADFCGNEPAEGTIKVIGVLTSGQYFCGTDTIKIINNSFEYLAVLASHWLDVGCGAPDWCGGFDVDQDSVVNFVDFAMLDGCCIEFIEE